MTLRKIVEYLDGLSPLELQQSWDNSGMIVGNMDQEIDNIYLSLDIDHDLVEQTPSNSLIITHHPLVFKALKCFNTNKYPTNIIKTLFKEVILHR